MRHDEEFAKDTVCDWLNTNGFSMPTAIIPEPFGEDTAPDYLFKFDDRQIYMEITRSAMGFLLKPKDVKFKDPNPTQNGHDRIKYEVSAGDFLKKQYETDVKNGDAWVCQGESLVVMILSPIPLKDRGKISKKLLKFLKKLYDQNEIPELKKRKSINEGEFTFLTGDKDLPGLTLQVFKTSFYKQSSTYSPIMVNFFATQASNNKPYDSSLNNQSWYILESIIKKKCEKCENLQEEVWLVILNEHSILDIKDYMRAMPDVSELTINSKFAKIFIVDQKKAHIFYERPLEAHLNKV